LKPKARFEILFGSRGLGLKGTSSRYFLEWGNVSELMIVPNPTPEKKGHDLFFGILPTLPIQGLKINKEEITAKKR